MFLLGNALIYLNFNKLKIDLRAWAFWLALIIEMFFFVTLKGKSAQIILGILISVFLVLEFIIYKRKLRNHYRYLKLTLGLFTLAVGALWLEKKSGLCNPENHFFQWHAVWDGFCAFTYLTVHKHFRQDHP